VNFLSHDSDSSTNVCIEDNYIESGDDLVAIKSGWDQYGIAVAKPSTNIIEFQELPQLALE
jgi:polygalacturonase